MSTKHKDAVQAVLNHKDCLFFDILLGLHYKEVGQKFLFTDRARLAWGVLRGDRTIGIIAMPSGKVIGEALEIVAERLDKE